MSGVLPYDYEVEYLESTGTQFIDTGVVVSNNGFNLDCDFISTTTTQSAWATYFGSYVNEQTISTRLINYSYADNIIYWAYRRTSSTQQTTSLSSEGYHVRRKYVLSAAGLTIYNMDGTVYSSQSSGQYGDTQDTSTVKLFGVDAFGAKMRCWGMKITHDGVLVRDFIPVRFTNEQGVSEGAMYDKVSGRLFRNAGTGAFVIGPDKAVMSVHVMNLHLMRRPRYTAKSYVRDGLIAMWDGIENAGWGVHNASATTWKDLVGDNDLTIYGSVLDNCISTTSTAAAEMTGTISGIATIEVCHKFTTTQNLNQQGLIFYSGAMNRSALGLVYYGPSVGIQSYGDVFWAYPSVMTPATRTTTVTTSACYINGNALEAVSHSADNWNNTNYTGIGGRQWQNTWKTFGEYYNARIYNRALTATEIARNYEIDKRRFNLP